MDGDDVRQIRRFEGNGGVYQGVCGCVGLLQGRKLAPCGQDSGWSTLRHEDRVLGMTNRGMRP